MFQTEILLSLAIIAVIAGLHVDMVTEHSKFVVSNCLLPIPLEEADLINLIQFSLLCNT